MHMPLSRGSYKGSRVVLKGLAKTYPDVTAVDHIDLDVEGGEFVTLLGPSGSGKTTTLMMIAGFTPPTRGEVFVDGREITGIPPEKRNIGVVFQNYALFPHMNVFNNVAFPLKMRSVGKSTIRDKVESILKLVHLEGLESRLTRQLSGGQQQRVAVARALVFSPDILLMDEPLGALDKSLREEMQVELKELHRKVGITVIYVTHDQGESLTLSDRVALMRNGRIEQVGSAEQLYERPASRFVAEFIGESNIIGGRLVPDETGALRAFVANDGGPRFVVSTQQRRLQAGQSCLLVLRPEKVLLTPADQAPDNAIRARVEERTYVGDFTKYRVKLEGGLVLTAKCQNNRSFYRAQEGDPVALEWDLSDTCILSESNDIVGERES